ncbi:substrate-binding periplasmic protein [Pseudoduganella namucuonensis]|uniref:Polar amino acid transport system substrate-binding protein n=1 Tax=Pseudoduganella namucuonensis TaxID=1035707 RepID=A0A1I7JUQ3_9BURK|nr:ABC transporter substrate-binding protein [Pseudoduganella namucuonensis]SFU88866.1 polar amino acid transport system substrate-binding protein [Pseudoduganella namucuonensis]
MAKHLPLLALLLAASGAMAETLYIAAEHSPPASMREGGEVTGRETEKIREMLARLAVPYKIDILPWKRAYTMARERPHTCVYSTARTPEREKQFKWAGPTDEAEWIFLGRADHKFQLRTLDDARSLRIGTYHGDARDEFLRARGFNVEPVLSDASNPKKLLLNRIDLWAVGVRVGAAPPQQQIGADGAIVPLLVFHRVKVYLACNPTVPDALVERMNATLEAMRRDGSFARLERKYAELEKRK